MQIVTINRKTNFKSISNQNLYRTSKDYVIIYVKTENVLNHHFPDGIIYCHYLKNYWYFEDLFTPTILDRLFEKIDTLNIAFACIYLFGAICTQTTVKAQLFF